MTLTPTLFPDHNPDRNLSLTVPSRTLSLFRAQGDREADMEPAVLSGAAPTLVSQLSGSIRRPSQILATALRKTSLDVRG